MCSSVAPRRWASAARRRTCSSGMTQPLAILRSASMEQRTQAVRSLYEPLEIGADNAHGPDRSFPCRHYHRDDAGGQDLAGLIDPLVHEAAEKVIRWPKRNLFAKGLCVRPTRQRGMDFVP